MFNFIYNLFANKDKQSFPYIKIVLLSNSNAKIEFGWPKHFKDNQELINTAKNLAGLIIVTINPDIWDSVRSELNSYGIASNTQEISKLVNGFLEQMLNQHQHSSGPVVSPLEAFNPDD